MNVFEHTHVESPLLDQLSTMGWRISIGNSDDPHETASSPFRDVSIVQELRADEVRVTTVGGATATYQDQNVAEWTILRIEQRGGQHA